MSAVPLFANGLRGGHVLAFFLAFFGVIFAVNGVFLYAALSTHTGLVAQEPYRKGLHYNDRIAAAARQEALRWMPDLRLVAESGALTLALTDASGLPVPGLEITGAIGRPSTVQHDTKLALSETAPGRYAADVGAREPGDWLVTLEAARVSDAGRDIVYRLRRRLWLKP